MNDFSGINSEHALLGLLIKSPELIENCQLLSNYSRPFSGQHANEIFNHIQKLYSSTGKVDFGDLMKLGSPKIPFELYSTIIRSGGFDVNLNKYIE